MKSETTVEHVLAAVYRDRRECKVPLAGLAIREFPEHLEGPATLDDHHRFPVSPSHLRLVLHVRQAYQDLQDLRDRLEILARWDNREARGLTVKKASSVRRVLTACQDLWANLDRTGSPEQMSKVDNQSRENVDRLDLVDLLDYPEHLAKMETWVIRSPTCFSYIIYILCTDFHFFTHSLYLFDSFYTNACRILCAKVLFIAAYCSF